MYLGILALPLLSFVIVGLFGSFIGRKGSCILTLVLVGSSSLLSFFIFSEIFYGGIVSVVELFPWFSIGSFFVHWSFLFDPLTSGMLLIITCISFLVHLYSTSYMEYDPHLPRFMSYLSLFTFFMICLVTSNNYLQLFLGWEGVGISSYLLINFWYTRFEANKASLKAIIVNRFGDFFFLLALFCLFIISNSFDFSVIFSLANNLSFLYLPIFSYEVHAISLAVFFLFLGAVGKSAQLGLHTWLPDAMEGPTPVSALIHAATMVTAGVFLIIRSGPLLEYSSVVLVIITFFGAITAFFAGTIGIFQNDLKRVIAYSTCSQLGYMVFAVGLSNYSVAMFHLVNHAFFKALLFLSAGSVIHALLDEQDMRRMGGLLHLLPFTYIMFIIGSLSLMGFPFTTGFYSKDVILEIAFSSYSLQGIFAYWMGVLGACCTAFYSYRLLYITFLSEINFSKIQLNFVHDVPLRMGIPLFFLGFGSIFIGFLFKDLFIGVGTNIWGNSIVFYNAFGDLAILEAEFLPIYIKFLPVFLSIFFGLFGLMVYEYFYFVLYESMLYKSFLYYCYAFFSKKWWFDHIYNTYIVLPVLRFGYDVTFKMIDRGFLEIVGPTGGVRSFIMFMFFNKTLQSGYFFKYIFAMVISIIFFVGFISYEQSIFNITSGSVLFLLIIGINLYFLQVYKDNKS